MQKSNLVGNDKERQVRDRYVSARMKACRKVYGEILLDGNVSIPVLHGNAGTARADRSASGAQASLLQHNPCGA